MDEKKCWKEYDDCKGEAWSAFYKLSVQEVQENFIEAFSFLMKRGFRMILAGDIGGTKTNLALYKPKVIL